MIGREGGEKMKTIQLLLSALLFSGTLGFSPQWLFAEAMPEDAPSATVLGQLGNYCHMKFPAIREETLGSDHPIAKDADSGDNIDFYGPCDHDPQGKDEIQAQLIQTQHRRNINGE
jgi:hypothetical protein